MMFRVSKNKFRSPESLRSLNIITSNQRFATALLCHQLFWAVAWSGHAAPAGIADAIPSASQIEEIIVSGQRERPDTEPSVLTEQLLRVPGTFGDPFGAVFTLPGVVEETEGDGQPAVRGTGPEDNAFLIDYLPASYVFHDLGMSIFNEHLVRDFGLQAAGFGPEYEQATGAIFDVELRDPRNQPLTTTVDLSFLRAGVLVEGGVGKDQAFYLSARQSLIHYLIKALDDDLEEEDDIAFNRYPKWHDYQGKYSWTPNNKNRLTLLAIGSKDGAALTLGSRSEEALLDPGSTGRAELDTRFASQSLLWEYQSSKTDLRAGAGRLREQTEEQIGDGRDRLDVSTTGWTARFDLRHQYRPNHSFRIGGEARRRTHDYSLNLRYQSCSRFDPDCDRLAGTALQLADKQRIDTYAGFAQYQWRLGDSVVLEPGARFSRNKYLKETRLEPRIRASWQASGKLKISANYGKYHQLPFVDEIVPVIGNVELGSPEATHYVLGGEYRFNDTWTLNTDLYYKDLDNLVVNVDDDRNYINAARGKAWGAELLLRRHLTDRWYGWASFSYTKSKRTNTLNGESFAADHDTPLVANLVLNYQLRNWNFSARWNLRSGNPYTPITGNRENPDFPGSFLPTYGELNSKRASAFHRLDLRAERNFDRGRLQGSWYVDVINAYGARNSGSTYYEPEPRGGYELKKQKGLPVLPSIGLTLKF